MFVRSCFNGFSHVDHEIVRWRYIFVFVTVLFTRVDFEPAIFELAIRNNVVFLNLLFALPTN